MTDLVLLDRAEPGIVTVTLNRPEARNALSRALAHDLRATFERLAGEDDPRVVILTGAGDRAFSAGADLVERRDLSVEERTAHTEAIRAAAEAIAACPVPVIAAVRGYALAGGAEIAVACDLRVAASDAVFGFPEVRVGIFPGAGGVERVPRLVGLGAARDLLLTGRRVDAAEAYRLGLVDRLVPPERLLPEATALATEIAANAPLAVRALKQALAAVAMLPPAEAATRVAALRTELDGTADAAEGLEAFAARRSPRFTGR